jgi:CHAT domain-containing protein
MGHYEQAEPMYLETIELTETNLGKESPDYCWVLSNLAVLQQKMGMFDQAERALLEVLKLREKLFGKHHPEFAASLSNLALLYHDQGRLSKAEPLALEAKKIREQTLEKDDPDYAESLNNLANLYADIGQYDKSERYYLEELALYERVLGKEHPDYAMCLINLVTLYQEMYQFDKAFPLLQDAMKIQELSLGKEHPDYTASLSLMADLLRNKGKGDQAEPLLKEAMSIFEKHIGRDHPDFVAVQINLGSLLIDLGQYSTAESHLLEAKRVFEAGIVNPTQTNYLNCLISLSRLYESLGQFEKAEPLIVSYATIDRKILENAMDHLSERELNDYINICAKRQELVHSYLASTGSKVLCEVAFDNILFYKGFLLMAISKLIKEANSDSSTAEKFNILRACRQRLARQYSLPLGNQDSKLVGTLEKQSEEMEKEIARAVADYTEVKRQVSWKEVQASLVEGEAALEFVHFRKAANKKQDSVLYAALLVLPGRDQPRFVSLFEEKSLDHLLGGMSERKSDYVNNLYSLSGRGAITLKEPSKSLYEILWQPLEKELAGVRTIYFSPSGLLHRINLDAIPVSETETLADRYHLIELNSTRQLVLPAEIKWTQNNAVLYGGIRYDADSNDIQSEPLLASRSRGDLSFQALDSAAMSGSWKFLAWTEPEVNNIEKIMKTAGVSVELRKAGHATEVSFKNLGSNNNPSPRILHLATHGYFFEDAQQTTEKMQSSGWESVFKSSDHPMLRSGLIMAGGNAAWQGKQTPEGREDGILTAYEISQMNLSHTELVVLSACETGLGDIQGNEGVYGLQRAFKIAGAKYLIMSLWQVPDKQTSMLMTNFYKKWLEDKMTIRDAFHAAQKDMREMGFDPYQWAGFVLIE